MSIAFEELVQYCDQRESKHVVNEDQETARLLLCSEQGVSQLRTRLDKNVLQVDGVFPVRVPAGNRRGVAEAVVRANFGLKVGNFSLNMRDGELLFHVSTLLLEGHSPDALTERIVATVVTMLDRYTPAFMSVIYGNEVPKDAIDWVDAFAE